MGNFYYELGIQVVETCLVLQEQTGGITDLALIKQRIQRLKGSQAKVSEYACIQKFLYLETLYLFDL